MQAVTDCVLDPACQPLKLIQGAAHLQYWNTGSTTCAPVKQNGAQMTDTTSQSTDGSCAASPTIHQHLHTTAKTAFGNQVSLTGLPSGEGSGLIAAAKLTSMTCVDVCNTCCS